MLFNGIPRTMPLFIMLTKNELWLRANENVELLEAVHHSNLKDVTAMATLRKQWSVEEISVAAELVAARERAKTKLENADIILTDSVGVQQATSTQIAQHKALRFQTDGPVYDLCCGIGSDLLALPNQTIGVDHDELRCLMASQNSGKETKCEDVLQLNIPSNSLIHIDPSRRSSEKRLHSLDAMQPSIEEISTLALKCAGGCIKVSPAMNAEDLVDFPLPFELEYIEENGRVVQGVIWFGELALNVEQVTATSMTTHQSVTGVPESPPLDNNIRGWILEPNPALERAHLHGNIGKEFGGFEPSPQLGLLCSTNNPESPWFTSFEVLETTSLRLEKVKKAISTLGCTQVEVKTRGKTVDPNQWQNDLSTKSSGPLLTLFALRLGKKRIAVITRRHV